MQFTEYFDSNVNCELSIFYLGIFACIELIIN